MLLLVCHYISGYVVLTSCCYLFICQIVTWRRKIIVSFCFLQCRNGFSWYWILSHSDEAKFAFVPSSVAPWDFIFIQPAFYVYEYELDVNLFMVFRRFLHFDACNCTYSHDFYSFMMIVISHLRLFCEIYAILLILTIYVDFKRFWMF